MKEERWICKRDRQTDHAGLNWSAMNFQADSCLLNTTREPHTVEPRVEPRHKYKPPQLKTESTHMSRAYQPRPHILCDQQTKVLYHRDFDGPQPIYCDFLPQPYFKHKQPKLSCVYEPHYMEVQHAVVPTSLKDFDEILRSEANHPQYQDPDLVMENKETWEKYGITKIERLQTDLDARFRGRHNDVTNDDEYKPEVKDFIPRYKRHLER